MVIDAAAAGVRQVEVFVSEGCPHCAAAQAFVDQLASERGDVEVTIVDVRSVPGALGRLQELSRKSGIAQPGVPTIRIGDALIVGFDSPATTGARIRGPARCHRAGGCAGAAPSGEAGAAARRIRSSRARRRRPDAVDAAVQRPQDQRRDVGLPLFTLVIGALDGFNPCSMWVLILMLSMLATPARPAEDAGDRRHVRRDPGDRLLRVHGRLAEPVPADRAVAALGDRDRPARPRRRRDQPQGLRAPGTRHLAVDTRGGEAGHLPAAARHPPGRAPVARRRRRGRPRAAGAGRRAPVHVGVSRALHADPHAARAGPGRLLRLPAALQRDVHAGRRRRFWASASSPCPSAGCRSARGGC